MIELSQIPVSSKLKDLRGQINTMANEINTDQMVIGQVLNPSAEIYDINHRLIGAITASQWAPSTGVFAVCMPESNGVYVAQVFGYLIATPTLTKDGPIGLVVVHIPAVKLPNREAAVSTFVTPEHLGFTSLDTDDHPVFNTGLVFAVVAKGPNGSTAAATDITLCNDSTAVTLNTQLLFNPDAEGFYVVLGHTIIDS